MLRHAFVLPKGQRAQFRQHEHRREDEHALPEESRFAVLWFHAAFAHLLTDGSGRTKRGCHGFVKATAQQSVPNFVAGATKFGTSDQGRWGLLLASPGDLVFV